MQVAQFLGLKEELGQVTHTPGASLHGSFRDTCLWPAPAESLRPQMAESESRKVAANSKLSFRANALQSAQPGSDTSCVALERCVNLSLP